MKDTVVVERKKIKLKKAILITGLPGIGLIGRVVGKYLIDELKGVRIANLYSPHFPHQVFMTKKGGMKLIRNKFYLVKTKKYDLVLLIGDVQAITSYGQYEVADVILDYAKKVGIEKVLTIGGYSTGKINENRRIFGVATDKDLLKELKKYGVVFGVARGSIVGAAGLLPALSKLKGIRGACLMGETHGGYVDVTAAKNIVVMLSKLLEFKIDTTKLENKAKEGEKVLKKIEEELQKNAITPYEGATKDVSYIR
ncbi:proteasome assembly chaperone family protein [Candidatus Micrarchaeota archaeon]|nr:proteasome assembly chaperone family protein [Candidatus Micrarchaeota archaeon]